MNDVAQKSPLATPTGVHHARASIMRAEVAKTLRLAWRSRTGMYFEIPLFALAYFTVLLFIGRGRIPKDLIAPTLIGMVAAMVLHQQITRTFWGVVGERQAGTFERLHLSPVSPEALMLARQASTAVQALAVAALLAALTAVPAAVVWHIDARLAPGAVQALVPLVAAVVGGAGLALVVAGSSLLVRRFEIFIEMIFAVAIVLGGALIPLSQLPAPLGTLGRLAVPIAQPVAYARQILIENRSLLDAQVDWGLAWLIGQPILLLTLGIATYRLAQLTARRRGLLGRP